MFAAMKGYANGISPCGVSACRRFERRHQLFPGDLQGKEDDFVFLRFPRSVANIAKAPLLIFRVKPWDVAGR